MEILILSRSRDAHFNRRMAEEGIRAGVPVHVLNPLELSLAPRFQGWKAGMERISLCFLRTPPYKEEKDYFHTAARIVEIGGIKVVNPPSSAEISGNKLVTSAVLGHAGIPVLPSIGVRKTEHLDRGVEMLGGFPVFLKTLHGTRGIGVIFCPCRETLHACAQTLWAYSANLMMEKYAGGSRGDTVRVLTFRGRAVGAVRCSARDDSQESDPIHELYRSNFSRGGLVEAFDPAGEPGEIAVKAAHAVGLHLAGVDLIQEEGKWKVLEINSSPGIRGIEEASGINAAGDLMAAAVEWLS
jgi:ribosomal protein S6--L-glutamate ligase